MLWTHGGRGHDSLERKTKMSTGWEVTVQHRFGGHGGVSTEWEITCEVPDINSWLCNFFAGQLDSYPSVEPGTICSDRECRSFHLRQGVTPSTFGRIVSAVIMRNRRGLRSALLRANQELARHESALSNRAAKIKAGGCQLDGNKAYFSSEKSGASGEPLVLCRSCWRSIQESRKTVSA